jgi:hypothetical protein
MLCVICKRRFNRESSFYRHNWSDKHLLKQQILEYEKEIKELERKIAENGVVLHELQCQLQLKTLPIPVLEKATTYA